MLDSNVKVLIAWHQLEAEGTKRETRHLVENRIFVTRKLIVAF